MLLVRLHRLRAPCYRLVDEVLHDLRVDELEADVGQDQHGDEGHDALLPPDILEQECAVLAYRNLRPMSRQTL